MPDQAPPHPPIPQVDGVTHRFVDAGGLRVHVAEAGAGPPVLLLHGFPQHWYCWRWVAAELADTFRLLMPDLRGFGWTDAPSGGHHPGRFAADMLALLDALAIDRVHLLGHDWGGFTSFLLALRHPQRVRSALVCNTPHPWLRPSPALAPQVWRAWYAALVATPGVGPRVVRSQRFVGALMRLGGKGTLFDDDVVTVYTTPLAQPQRARAMSSLYRSYVRTLVGAAAPRRYGSMRLEVPTHLLFGRDDVYIPVAALSGWERHAVEMELELVEGCGHWTPEERPDLVAARARALFGRYP